MIEIGNLRFRRMTVHHVVSRKEITVLDRNDRIIGFLEAEFRNGVQALPWHFRFKGEKVNTGFMRADDARKSVQLFIDSCQYRNFFDDDLHEDYP